VALAAWLLAVAGWSATERLFAAEEFEPGSVPMKAEQVAPHSWYVLGQTGWSRRATRASTRTPASSSPPTASSSSMRSARRRSASASPT
jgi:hypothetical protein